jgi:class 3 adenylate cyclase
MAAIIAGRRQVPAQSLCAKLAKDVALVRDTPISDQHLGYQRREVVAEFCDLRGFTAFAETVEPEEIMTVLGEFYGTIGPLIGKHMGAVYNLAGDGLMVLFDDGNWCSDAPERASKLAIEMRDAVATLAQTWRRRGHCLGFGVGMAQGYAVLGFIGCNDHFQYAANGASINLAARLCCEATDGQVLVAGKLKAAVAQLAEVDNLGMRALKGIASPVAVANLCAMKNSGLTSALRQGGYEGV